jgi:hypothetical protein
MKNIELFYFFAHNQNKLHCTERINAKKLALKKASDKGTYVKIYSYKEEKLLFVNSVPDRVNMKFYFYRKWLPIKGEISMPKYCNGHHFVYVSFRDYIK